jgi:hypothetical protein
MVERVDGAAGDPSEVGLDLRDLVVSQGEAIGVQHGNVGAM